VRLTGSIVSDKQGNTTGYALFNLEPRGKLFFWVKNSCGAIGPFAGFINVSETYFGINTITLVLPKNSLSSEMRAKLKL